MSKLRLQEAIANDVIFNLDLAQEERELSDPEREMRRLLKVRPLGIAALERIKWRQRSRLTKIKAGDANTRLFHLRANGRRRKNHIPVLKKHCGTETNDHNEKAEILLRHFMKIMGSPFTNSWRFNWNALNLPVRDLSHLDADFSANELKDVIDEMHAESAPGPDGFTGLFLQEMLEHSSRGSIEGRQPAAFSQG